jgi:hypothetical protein
MGLPMVDVFISYSRSDEAKVAMLAHAVEAAGYDIWWDAELPPHQSYGEVITDKIEHAKAAIVLWSATAVKSEWVRAEADLARHHRKLVQTTVDDVIPPLPFNQIQYAELGDWHGEPDHPGWRKVLVSLADLCGRSAPEGRPARPVAASAPPRTQIPPPPVAASGGARWPLIAGIGIGAIGLVVAGIALLGQRSPAPPAPTPAVAVAAAPAAQVAAPPPPPAPAPYQAASAGDQVPLEPNPSDLSFPDSSTRLIQPSEVAMLGPSTLRYARNEIYARKGRRFADPDLRDYFSRFAWYRPRFDEVTLNPVERQNVALIQQAEQRYR